MKFGLVSDPAFLLHGRTGHVERPERLTAATEAVERLRESFDFIERSPRPATDSELLLVHQPRVLEAIEGLTAAGGGDLDPDTYLNAHSDQVARLAVGGGIDLCRAVLSGELDRGFLLARPPGHHARPQQSMGFCLYSTIAIAAKACADLCQRILILDWDVHHGNGTQDCLYDDGGTCFISLHQSPFYPGTGHLEERGEGAGSGLNYNIPMPAGCADEEYLAVYHRLVRPVIRAYDPELILVSAGFDAHRKDLLGGMKVSSEGFAGLAALIAEDADSTAAAGRLVGFLEGGYDLQALSNSLEATLRVWVGLDTSAPPPSPQRFDDQVRRRLAQAETRFFS